VIGTMPQLSIEALLVDMDGTLIDSTAAIEVGWRSFAEHWGLDPDELLSQIHGRRAADVIARYASQLPISPEQAIADLPRRIGEALSDVVALPGALHLLRSTPTDRLVVVSSATRAEIVLRLAAARLPRAPLMVGADDVDRGKPSPDPYRRGVQMLGLEPVRCLVLEDAPAGIDSASAAGCMSVGLLTTHTAVEMAGATYIADDLSAVTVTSASDALLVTVSTS